jgi:hypothetical protein
MFQEKGILMGKPDRLTLKSAMENGRLEEFARQQDEQLHPEPGHEARFKRLMARAAPRIKAPRKVSGT